MCKKITKVGIFILATAILFMGSCKNSDFDINSPNPNQPSTVTPNYVLASALASSASHVLGGNESFADFWMGYWAPYGEQSPTVLSYNLTTDLYSSNWDAAYLILENYKYIADQSASPGSAYYLAIAKIMKSFHFQRLVDLYNNIPYTEALNSANSFPKYDNAETVYKDLVVQLDSAIRIIENADVLLTENPGTNDVLFQGSMNMWVKFANTLKLKILMHQTQKAGGPEYIKSNLTGLSTADFLGEEENAGVNPGYSNSSYSQQNPLWQNVGYNVDGSPNGGYLYTRANSYAVDFYIATNDPRIKQFYAVNGDGIYRGRAFGSSDVGQGGNTISGFGSGLLNSVSMDAYILPAFESLFIQAEAAARGYIPGDAVALYKKAVTESFRILSVPDYQNAALTFFSQPGDKVNIDMSSNKINTIILQKWAALNAYDPLESYCDWRRLGVPADLAVSVYPGTTATHIPYRLLYPSSEFKYNSSNVSAQDNVNQFTSKIFWMP